jgi:hypothetical protein
MSAAARLPEEAIRALSGAIGRACGACSLCCKLLPINKPELKKPADKWCQHCRPGKGGCAIYDERPPVCREFACGWLVNSSYADEWYPLRSKIVVHATEEERFNNMRYVVDPSVPGRWREEPYHTVITANALRGLRRDAGEYFQTYVDVGKRVWLILPHHDVELTDSVMHTVIQTDAEEWEVLRFNNAEKARLVIDHINVFTQFVSTLPPEQRKELAAELMKEADRPGGAR